MNKIMGQQIKSFKYGFGRFVLDTGEHQIRMTSDEFLGLLNEFCFEVEKKITLYHITKTVNIESLNEEEKSDLVAEVKYE